MLKKIGDILMSDDPYAKYAASQKQDPYAQFKASEQPAQKIQPQEDSMLNKVANSWPVNATLGAGDAIRNLLSLGYTSNSPSGSGDAYKAGKLVGDIGGFIGGGELLDAARAGATALPLIGRGAQWLGREGLAGLTRRMSGSTLFGAAENPEDRISGAKQGFKAGLLGETVGAPFRFVGATAERANPVNYAQQLATQLRGEYRGAQQAQREAYAPVTERYGNHWLTPTPREYLNFAPNETRYFTPDVRKSYHNFLEEPTFNNLHNLQSQMGKDAARVSNSPNKINTAQTLSATRDRVNDRLTGYLSHDPEMAAQYQLGRDISREQFFPFHANPTLQKISQGLIENPTPSQLSSAIMKGTQKLNRMEAGRPIAAIPEHHVLNHIMDRIQNRISQGDLLKSMMPLLTGALGSPGGVMGTIGAGAAGHYLSPHALAAAQNPLTQHIMAGLSQLVRGTSQGLANNP